jgi:hypothetical protein
MQLWSTPGKSYRVPVSKINYHLVDPVLPIIIHVDPQRFSKLTRLFGIRSPIPDDNGRSKDTSPAKLAEKIRTTTLWLRINRYVGPSHLRVGNAAGAGTARVSYVTRLICRDN